MSSSCGPTLNYRSECPTLSCHKGWRSATTFTGLGSGIHTIHIAISGQKNTEATDYYVDVDAITSPSNPFAITGQNFATKNVNNVVGVQAEVFTDIQPDGWHAIGSPLGVCTTTLPCTGAYFETGFSKGLVTPVDNVLQQYAVWIHPTTGLPQAQYDLGGLSDNTWYTFQASYNSTLNRWQARRNGVLIFTTPYALSFSSGNMVACGGEGGGIAFPMKIDCADTEYKTATNNWTLYDATNEQTYGLLYPYCLYIGYGFNESISSGPC